MSDTAGLIIGWSVGTAAGGVLSYFGARWFATRNPLVPSLPIYPPCRNCGKPTGSPRLSECGECHRRRLLAEFDARVAHYEARSTAMWAELGLDASGEKQG